MTYSVVTYTGNGSTTDFSVTFPFLDKNHVEVLVGGVVQTLTTNYSWINSTTIRLVNAPASGVLVKLLRKSSRTTKLVDFQDGSILSEAALDKANNQSFYMAQEALDTTENFQSDLQTAETNAVAAASSATASANSATAASNSATASANSATASANSATASANSATEAATYSNARVRNYIIGGDFSTNPWQRGTSLSGLATVAYLADRFRLAASASGVWTMAKIADGPTFAQAGRYITHCMETLVTLDDATVAASDYAFVSQFIEGYNYLPLYQKTQRVGFWAKSNLIGDYGVSLRSGALDQSFVGKITINAMNTWEYKTVLVNSAPVGGTWNFSNGIGVELSIALVSGTTLQTATLDAWQTGNLLAPTTQVNLANTANNYFRIADVKLIEGSVDVTPYQPTAEEVLTACQRYYQTGTVSARFYATAASQVMDVSIAFPVTMRAAPSTTNTGTARSNLLAAALAPGDAVGARFEILSAAVGDAYSFFETYTASAEL